MLNYPIKATTAKTISQFYYELYSCIGVNMLKYNHDSSSVFRLFQSLCEDSFSILEDLYYQPRFSLRNIDFMSIDRIRKFLISSIPSINYVPQDYGDPSSGYIVGLSRYTGKEYTLKLVDNVDDFSRHSFPCDMFVTGNIAHNESGSYDLPPYFLTTIDMDVTNSQITIDVLGGITIFTKDSQELVVIRINGKDILNNDISEDITILDQTEYISTLEYSSIDSMLLIGNSNTASIRVYPYINGQVVDWTQKYIDREDFEEYRAVLSVDQMNKMLVISRIMGLATEYPNIPDPVENIVLKTKTRTEVISSYFLDVDNKIIYTTTNEENGSQAPIKRFYCYPLIMPYKKSNQLEIMKTDYQSIRLEYYMDTINRECTFYVFPAERHNGIESLNIVATKISKKDSYPSWNSSIMYFTGDEVAYNGELYTCLADHTSTASFDTYRWQSNVISIAEDVMLDLYREGIETNRIIVPFDTLFPGDSDECIVTFSTYGDGESILPIYLFDRKLDPLYVKTLAEMRFVWDTTTPPSSQWLTESDISSPTDYQAPDMTGFGSGNLFIYKLSNVGNVCLNNTTVTSVFDTFIYDNAEKSITTSDTITSVRGSAIEV